MQRILAALAEEQEHRAQTVADLAQRIGCSDRQSRRAVRSLEERELVAITRESLGWKGSGEDGRLLRKRPYWPTKDMPTVAAVRKGEPIPDWVREQVVGYVGSVAWEDCEFTYRGMPTHGLLVWLRDERIVYLEEIRQRWGDLNWPPDREEYGRLTGNPVRQTFTIPG